MMISVGCGMNWFTSQFVFQCKCQAIFLFFWKCNKKVPLFQNSQIFSAHSTSLDLESKQDCHSGVTTVQNKTSSAPGFKKTSSIDLN